MFPYFFLRKNRIIMLLEKIEIIEKIIKIKVKNFLKKILFLKNPI